ncbi:MAG: hypothetical protein CME70_12800 [Halobacteriovorax sp.]|nr:hypothetical protein [Halobacteriovorax sp.]|tara:strand:- start:174314 stop:174928 length:615 start_codon:yes stop_codon:yes gene_type:complete
MKMFLSFVCGTLFGVFIVINLWQPNLESKKTKNEDSADVQIKRFEKNFKLKDLNKKSRRDKSIADQMDDDLKDMQDQMERAFKDTGSIFKMMENSIQDATIGAMGVKVGEIVEKVTNDSVILEMDISNIDNSSINIEVKNGQVSISGEARIEKREEGSGINSKRVMVTSFSRVHPVPTGTRASGLRIENKDENTLQMIFPKVDK